MRSLFGFFRLLWRIMRDAFVEWWEDDATRLAAAVTFYTIFSLAPLVIIAVSIAGTIFGQKAAEGQLLDYVKEFTSEETAGFIQTIIESAYFSRSGFLYTILGILALLIGATAVFAELQHALNRVWEVRSSGGIRGLLMTRLLSFLVVLGIGGLLIAALIASNALALAASYFGDWIPFLPYVFFLLSVALPFLLMTVLFAMFYKVLPDVHIGWSDVWVGALSTAALFALGNYLLGFYLRHGSISSAYGAAGSFVVFLLWIYYSVQIFLLGAEIAHAYGKHLGTEITPARGAVSISHEKRKAEAQ